MFSFNVQQKTLNDKEEKKEEEMDVMNRLKKDLLCLIGRIIKE